MINEREKNDLSNIQSVTVDNLWEIITARQGQPFYTKKGLLITYVVKGGELFTSRRDRSITRSTFEKAYLKIKENPEKIIGPKTLNVFGAPYVWAILQGIGAID